MRVSLGGADGDVGTEGTLVTGLGFSHLGVMGPGHRPTEFVAALSKDSAWRSALLGGRWHSLHTGIPFSTVTQQSLNRTEPASGRKGTEDVLICT